MICVTGKILVISLIIICCVEARSKKRSGRKGKLSVIRSSSVEDLGEFLK